MEERDKTMSECTHNCETCHAKCSERQGEMPPSRLDKIKHKLLVLSGKGGVGKSTMAAGLAVSLAKAGYKVALLDVDFHGPSQPTLFGLKDHRLDGDEEGINRTDDGFRQAGAREEELSVEWRCSPVLCRCTGCCTVRIRKRYFL